MIFSLVIGFIFSIIVFAIYFGPLAKQRARGDFEISEITILAWGLVTGIASLTLFVLPLDVLYFLLSYLSILVTFVLMLIAYFSRMHLKID